MLLSERVRIEVFLPDLPDPSYADLLAQLETEFSYAFGGCTVIAASGSFLSSDGSILPDRINILFTDVPLELQSDRLLISQYVDRVSTAIHDALGEEEAVLVASYSVYHAD